MNCAGPMSPNSASGFRKPTMRRTRSFPSADADDEGQPVALQRHAGAPPDRQAGRLCGLHERPRGKRGRPGQCRQPEFGAARAQNEPARCGHPLCDPAAPQPGRGPLRRAQTLFQPRSDRVYRDLGDGAASRHRTVARGAAGRRPERRCRRGFPRRRGLRRGGGSWDHRPEAGRDRGRIIRANFDYRLPFFDPLSLDLADHQPGRTGGQRSRICRARRTAADDRPRTIVDVGARYRFRQVAPPRPCARRSPTCSTFMPGTSAQLVLPLHRHPPTPAQSGSGSLRSAVEMCPVAERLRT